ncbi:hypothetical protein NDU88_006252 [Pleurodeles waltl]|uniref:Secreted protein n=1 Tax=Pleurodeles waltl TaxID=8319 RepID=A0AAV7WXQ2_PLEWA|nr:hypothetical protein NDU88_006252 [Pleurodeles waltl]
MPMGHAATPALCCSVSFTAACRPQHSQGPRSRSGEAPPCRPTGRIFNWAPDPYRHLRCSGETRPESPAVFGPTALGSLQPAVQHETTASGPCPRGRASFAPRTLWGRHGGPATPGYRRQCNTSARTRIGPEKVRFLTFSRRPLRSEKFRRAPSLDPWPRPKLGTAIVRKKQEPAHTHLGYEVIMVIVRP